MADRWGVDIDIPSSSRTRGRSKLHRALYSKNSSIRKSRRATKNRKRRLRRKRSIIRYYTNLKQLRRKRRTDDDDYSSLLLGVTELDMECVPFKYCTRDHPVADVVDWHKHEQIVYWKSRAIGLEYENRMLYAHLKYIYEHQIKEIPNSCEPSDFASDSTCKLDKTEAEHSKNILDSSSKKVNRKSEGLERKEDMIKLYGNAVSKITGMETAMQLNYDHNTTHSKISYWPNMPLRLNSV